MTVARNAAGHAGEGYNWSPTLAAFYKGYADFACGLAYNYSWVDHQSNILGQNYAVGRLVAANIKAALCHIPYWAFGHDYPDSVADADELADKLLGNAVPEDAQV